jgi:hypothetical protein
MLEMVMPRAVMNKTCNRTSLPPSFTITMKSYKKGKQMEQMGDVCY